MIIGAYTKAIAAAVVAGGTAAITALHDGVIVPEEWVAITIAFLVALGGVWAVPNVPKSVATYGKAIVAGLIAALGALGTALASGVGISPNEWITIGIALLGGLGLVGIAPNAAASDNLIEYPDDEYDEDGEFPPLPADDELPPRPPGFVDNP